MRVLRNEISNNPCDLIQYFVLVYVYGEFLNLMQLKWIQFSNTRCGIMSL